MSVMGGGAKPKVSLGLALGRWRCSALDVI